jgi:hypothetical protein
MKTIKSYVSVDQNHAAIVVVELYINDTYIISFTFHEFKAAYNFINDLKGLHNYEY